MKYEQIQKLIGRTVVEVCTYVDGYWLRLDNGVMTFIDSES